MIYVYRVPREPSAGFCTGMGNPVSMLNVDWFNSPSEMDGFANPLSKEDFIAFIKGKKYAIPGQQLLVMDTTDDYTMRIDV